MRLLFLLSLLLYIVGCHHDSNNDQLFSDNSPPSENIHITTTTMGFGHIAEGPEDIFGPFTFETEGTFVGVPNWTFSGELLDARLQPLPGVGNTIGILVGLPATVGTFFITATVIDTGNGATDTVTVPFTVVDCTPGLLGTSILDVTASVGGLATEGTPFPVSVAVTGALSTETVVWRATSADPTVSFSFFDPSNITTMFMTGHTVADSPIAVVITAIDNAANIDEIDADGFYEQVMGSGSGCSASITLNICVAGGACGGGGAGGGGAGGGGAGGGGASVFVSTDTPATIPDPGTTTSTITVPTGTTATSVRVGLDIDHTFISDLTISLDPPGAAAITLVSGVGGSGIGMDIILDSTTPSLPSITTFTGGTVATPPFPSFSPFPGSLTSFGGTAEGDWVLSVTDTSAIFTGTLNEWAIAFDGATFPAPYE